MSLNKQLSLILLLFWLCPPFSRAISVGDLTFSIPSGTRYISKKIVNQNSSARLYQVSVIAIDKPGQHEIVSTPPAGELLYAPQQVVLSSGESEYFKFYYHGPEDDHERYYRVLYKEIPTQNYLNYQSDKNAISLDPVIELSTILIVRPRKVHFRWQLEKQKGQVINSGNTWFRLISKPSCTATEQQSQSWYLLPGESVTSPSLTKPGDKYIIYNDQFINIAPSCQDQRKDK